MKVLVTGASGFLGRSVVSQLLKGQHCVRAMVRPAASVKELPWHLDPSVEIVRCDLRSPHGLDAIVTDVSCVVHLAAAKSGGLHEQLAGTVVATENLLHALDSTSVQRVVLTSSFALYDYLNNPTGVIDEASCLEKNVDGRDAYCQTKMLQEQRVIHVCDEQGMAWVVLRPGVIYGPGHWWTARLGIESNRGRPLFIGGDAPLPLTYVEHCAQAVALSVDSPEASGKIMNVVDDGVVTQRQYAALLKQIDRGFTSERWIPWWFWRGMVFAAASVNRFCFGNRARLPGVLIRSRACSRFRPMVYSNRLLKETLGWNPERTPAEVVACSADTTDVSSPMVSVS